ncbi:CBS domain-containing protein [Forsythia ovata]|uniref:CBS domain-containing protein n=1 Tax=Forsythia ovata TaxID=205694 RepID=A0ABD1QBQ7_9LAMI
MAISFLNGDISDLCLGKPAVRWIPATATVSDAVTALKRSGETHVSVWTCDNNTNESCECVGKICMTDVICFLCREENLANPLKAFEAPISEILPKGSSIVRHLGPNSSLLEAIDCILEGTQNLVIPIQNHRSTFSRKKFPNKLASLDSKYCKASEYCWLTQEDIVRFLLNSVGVFSPIPGMTIESLLLIQHDIMTIHYLDPASSALDYISRSLTKQTSVAVIDKDNRLIGEISPVTLACCDEIVAAAISTLSAGDLMAYIDCGGPPEYLVELVKIRLEERNFVAMLELMEEFSISSISSSSSSCSSDDELGSSFHGSLGRNSTARRSEAIICYPWSSLVAVMFQALAHRVSCVWVVEEDHTLVGTVTFAGILKVFRSIAGVNPKRETSFKQ